MPTDSHWADHCVSCHRIALSAGRGPKSRTDHRRRCPHAGDALAERTGFGATPNEIAACLLALAADYTLRLSDLSPVGSRLMTLELISRMDFARI